VFRFFTVLLNSSHLWWELFTPNTLCFSKTASPLRFRFAKVRIPVWSENEVCHRYRHYATLREPYRSCYSSKNSCKSFAIITFLDEKKEFFRAISITPLKTSVQKEPLMKLSYLLIRRELPAAKEWKGFENDDPAVHRCY